MVFQLWDTPLLREKLPKPIQQYVLDPYLSWARGIVRFQTDVVMVTHLLLYFTTLVPSAIYLYYHFTWVHGVVHWAMQLFFCGAFTLMKHQHIHMNGVLAPKYWLFDTLFPYLLDPMLGHTWNSYYYHHIKHHHVEGNGANDLSTTMFYDRDSLFDFACYVGRFFFFIWAELPLYFWRKGQVGNACRAGFWELSDYASLYLLYNYVNPRATLFVFILPLLVMRCGLMVGNWGQHAFVDPSDPDSDYLSSITLIDVPVSIFLLSFFLAPMRQTLTTPEQPLLLQRRLPHLAPLKPPPPLARPPRSLHQAKRPLRRGKSTRLPKHRLHLHHRAPDAQGLPAPGQMSHPDGRAGPHDHGRAHGDAAPPDTPVPVSGQEAGLIRAGFRFDWFRLWRAFADIMHSNFIEINL